MISPSQRPLPDNTQPSQQTNIHAPSGIRTHDLSRRAAVDLRLRPCGHWDRPLLTCYFLQSNFHRKLQTTHYTRLAVVEATVKVTVVTPYYSGNKFKVSVAVFFSFTTSLMYNRCLILLMNHDCGKLKKTVITWHYVNETERDLARDW